MNSRSVLGFCDIDLTFYLQNYYCIFTRDAEFLFFLCGTSTSTSGLESLGLQTPTLALKILDSDSGLKIRLRCRLYDLFIVCHNDCVLKNDLREILYSINQSENFYSGLSIRTTARTTILLMKGAQYCTEF